MACKPTIKRDSELGRLLKLADDFRGTYSEVMTMVKGVEDQAPQLVPSGKPVNTGKVAAGTPVLNRTLTPDEQAESDKVGQKEIKDKFNDAPKWVADREVTIMVNGQPVTGHYALVPASSVTASHNPHEEFKDSKGFPVDEKGNNVNTTDYKDKEVQGEVKAVGGHYNQSAIDNVPTVTMDGVVDNGSNRVMGAQLAEKNGTMQAYDEELLKRIGEEGQPSYIPGAPTKADYDHVATAGKPILVFIRSTIPEYTPQHFASFNRSDMKMPSVIQDAIILGRTVSDALMNAIMDIISKYDTMSRFYDNPTDTAKVFGLLTAGPTPFIHTGQAPHYISNGDVSATGEQFLESLLLGKLFDPETLKILDVGGMRNFRGKIVRVMKELSEINQSPQYGLGATIDKAVALLNEYRRNGHGMTLNEYLEQGKLPQQADPNRSAESIMMASALLQNPTEFKNFITAYQGYAEGAATSTGGLAATAGLQNEAQENVLKKALNLNDKQFEAIQTLAGANQGGQPGTTKGGKSKSAGTTGKTTGTTGGTQTSTGGQATGKAAQIAKNALYSIETTPAGQKPVYKVSIQGVEQHVQQIDGKWYTVTKNKAAWQPETELAGKTIGNAIASLVAAQIRKDAVPAYANLAELRAMMLKTNDNPDGKWTQAQLVAEGLTGKDRVSRASEALLREVYERLVMREAGVSEDLIKPEYTVSIVARPKEGNVLKVTVPGFAGRFIQEAKDGWHEVTRGRGTWKQGALLGKTREEAIAEIQKEPGKAVAAAPVQKTRPAATTTTTQQPAKKTLKEQADYMDTLPEQDVKEGGAKVWGRDAYDYWVGRKLMPKKKNTTKRISQKDVNEFGLLEYTHIANVNGEPYGVEEEQYDPDNPDAIKYYYTRLQNPQKATPIPYDQDQDLGVLMDMMIEDQKKPVSTTPAPTTQQQPAQKKSPKDMTKEERHDLTPAEYADYLDSLSEADREEVDFYENHPGYQYWQAKQMLPKKVNGTKFKKLDEIDDMPLSDEYEYIANINGEPYGLVKRMEEDEDGEETGEYSWAFTRIRDGREAKTVESITDDATQVVEEMKDHDTTAKAAEAIPTKPKPAPTTTTQKKQDFNTGVDEATDKFINFLKGKVIAKTPPGTKKSGLGVEDIIRGAAAIIKAAYAAKTDMTAAVNEAVDYAKKQWRKARNLGKFPLKEIREHLQGIADMAQQFGQQGVPPPPQQPAEPEVEKETIDAVDKVEIPEEDVLEQSALGEHLQDAFGRVPEGKDEFAYRTMTLEGWLNAGRQMLQAAITHFTGTTTNPGILDYGYKVFNYLRGLEGKTFSPRTGILLATFLSKVQEEKARAIANNDPRRGEIEALEKRVVSHYGQYMRARARELTAGRLLRLFRDHDMKEFFADLILRDEIRKKERETRRAKEQTEEGIDEDVQETAHDDDVDEADNTAAEAADKKSYEEEQEEAPPDETPKEKKKRRFVFNMKKGKQQAQAAREAKGASKDFAAQQADDALEGKDIDDLLAEMRRQQDDTNCA